MIVVDTSVWVSAFRSRASFEAKVLDELVASDDVGLAAPVRLELLSGCSRRNREPLERSLSPIPVLYPTDETWQIVRQWVVTAVDVGERFGISDLLIGAMASEQSALVWSLDGDFVRMERLGLIQRYVP